jgi:predicted Zn-dependent protease
VPRNFRLINQPEEVIAVGPDGSIILFDAAQTASAMDPLVYLTQVWMGGEELQASEKIMINGMDAATAAFNATVNGRPATLRIVAIQWEPNRFFRFQMSIPRNADSSLVEGLKLTTYSFRRMSEEQRRTIKPYYISTITASSGDTVASMAGRMAFDNLREERFRVLNAMAPGERLQAGRAYKIVTE